MKFLTEYVNFTISQYIIHGVFVFKKNTNTLAKGNIFSHLLMHINPDDVTHYLYRPISNISYGCAELWGYKKPLPHRKILFLVNGKIKYYPTTHNCCRTKNYFVSSHPLNVKKIYLLIKKQKDNMLNLIEEFEFYKSLFNNPHPKIKRIMKKYVEDKKLIKDKYVYDCDDCKFKNNIKSSFKKSVKYYKLLGQKLYETEFKKKSKCIIL